MKITREQGIDLIVLALRWYLAYYMADYGWGKLTGEQFGVHNPEILEKPLKHVDKFYLSWYLFSLSKTFNVVVGLSQILGAILIVINRTAILGAFFLLPILVQIFLIDVSFTTTVFGAALPLRLAGMMLSDLLILYYYRDKVKAAFKTLTQGVTTRYKYKWWVFLLLPLVGLLMDFVWAAALWPFRAILHMLIR